MDLPHKQVKIHNDNVKEKLPTITEVSENSNSTNGESDNSLDSLAFPELDLFSSWHEGEKYFNVSETGVIIERNVFDWEMSSVDSEESSTSSSDIMEEVPCIYGTSLLSLIEKLEKLCLSDSDNSTKDTFYQALSLVPINTLGSNIHINDSGSLSNPIKLTRSQSLPNLLDFSGFTKDSLLKNNGSTDPALLAGRLSEISRGLADIRETVLQHRRCSLERVRETVEFSKTRMENINLHLKSEKVKVSKSVRSPPFLRSRGKTLEIEHIPTIPVEYKRRRKEKKE